MLLGHFRSLLRCLLVCPHTHMLLPSGISKSGQYTGTVLCLLKGERETGVLCLKQVTMACVRKGRHTEMCRALRKI